MNNVVRGALQAMALVMAGVQAIEISAFDEGYRIPSPEAHLVGLRTRQILELETDVANALDPLGGSFLVESLTAELERDIRAYIANIESLGDPGTLCDAGFFSRLFEDAMVRTERDLASGRVPRVGVNVHRVAPDDDRLLRDVVETRGRSWRERIRTTIERKQARSQGVVAAAVGAVTAAAADTARNLMPAILEAMTGGVTVGEIAAALKAAYGVGFDPLGAPR